MKSSIFLVFISILFSIQTSLRFVLQTFCSNAEFTKVDFFLHVQEFGKRHNLLSRTSENSKCFPHSLGIRDIEVGLYLKAFIQNLVHNGPVVSEKIRFEFLYVHDLGPRSRNDLDLQYSHNFMKSISCLYLPTFRSQASIVSEKSTVFTFSYRKAFVSKFDLAVK